MKKEDWLLKEYELVRERVNKHEDVSFRMLDLNVTAFAAIFAFAFMVGKQDITLLLPWILVAVLLVCAKRSFNARREKTWGIAFLVERNEKLRPGDSFESGTVSRFESRNIDFTRVEAVRGLARRLLFCARVLVCEPFCLLMLVSLVSGFFVSYFYWISLFRGTTLAWILKWKWIAIIVNWIAIFTPHFFVIYWLQKDRKEWSMEVCRQEWRKYWEKRDITTAK